MDGEDIVIDGWENGIAASPLAGLGDMRNVDILSQLGIAAVGFKNIPVTFPPVLNAVAFTASASTDRLTIADASGLYPGCAIVLNTNSAGNLSTGIVYYVRNIVGNTFQVSVGPLSSVIDISSDGSGTLTTYQYGSQRAISSNASPVSYYIATNDNDGVLGKGVFVVDASNYLWFIHAAAALTTANHATFLGNIGGLGAGVIASSGVVSWKGYVILMGPTSNLNIMDLGDFVSNGPAASWNYSFGGVSASGNSQSRVPVISSDNGSVYWSNGNAVSSLTEVAGETFDPSDPTTYTVEAIALDLPTFEGIESLCMYNGMLYIGSRYTNLIYPWDTISPSFQIPVICPEKIIGQMVAASQTMYVFPGFKGNIYQCNGSSMDLFWTVPSSISGVFNPYYRWQDANVDKNQLYMAITAVQNGSNSSLLTTVAGAWALDISTGAFRLLNKISSSGYSGFTSMVAPSPDGRSAGNGVYVGFVQDTTYAVDCGSSDPYSNFEAYIETDIIPIGSYFSPTTLQEAEYKLAAPLAAGESLRFSQRSNLNSAYVEFWTSSATGKISDISQSDDPAGGLGSIDWENVQWIQVKIELSSTNTTPSYVQLREFRLR